MAFVRATPQFLVGTAGVPELGIEFGGVQAGVTTAASHGLDHANLQGSVTGSRNLTIADADKVLICNHATVAIVLTITTDAIAGWTGAVSIGLAQTGAASATFAAGAGVTLRSSHPAASQYTAKGVLRIGTNEWMCV